MSILQNWVIISSWYQPLSHANLHKMWHENLCKFGSCSWSRLQLISHQQRNSMEFLPAEIRVAGERGADLHCSHLNWILLLHAEHCSRLLQCCSVIRCFYQLWQLCHTPAVQLYSWKSSVSLCNFVSTSKVMKDCSQFENHIFKPQTNGSISITLSLVSICSEF